MFITLKNRPNKDPIKLNLLPLEVGMVFSFLLPLAPLPELADNDFLA